MSNFTCVLPLPALVTVTRPGALPRQCRAATALISRPGDGPLSPSRRSFFPWRLYTSASPWGGTGNFPTERRTVGRKIPSWSGARLEAPPCLLRAPPGASPRHRTAPSTGPASAACQGRPARPCLDLGDFSCRWRQRSPRLGPARPQRPSCHSRLSQPQGCSASRPHSPADGPDCGRRWRGAASPRRARGPDPPALTLAVPVAQRSATGRQQEQGQRRAKPVGRPHPASPGRARRTGTTGTATPRRLPPPPPHWPAPRPAATLCAPIGRDTASTGELAAADWGKAAERRRAARVPAPLRCHLCYGKSLASAP